MKVRGKFIVDQVVHTQYAAKTVSLRAICDESSDENMRFSKATPSGTIVMAVDNPSAAEQFVPGKAVYVDFSDAPN